jgi:hypothetical protein
MKGTLNVDCEKGGSFGCSVLGECTSTTPQGLIVVKTNRTVEIAIKDTINSEQFFVFSVDNPDFIDKGSEQMPGKKQMRIVVQYKPRISTWTTSSCRLTIFFPFFP